MTTFVLKRLASLVVLLVVLTAVMFLLQRVSKTDPIVAYLGRGATGPAAAQARHHLGFDRPLIVQYVRYVDDVAHGNLQMSLHTHHPVMDDLKTYLPPTLELLFTALGLSLIGALILGTVSAMRLPGAGLLRLVMVAGAAAPTFLLGQLGVVFFYRRLGWLPATGQTSRNGVPTGPTGFLVLDALFSGDWPLVMDAVKHLVMPAACLAIGPAVAIGRVLRSSLMSSMDADYTRTARSKGLRESAVVLRHALRNAASGPAQMTGLQVGFMFAGIVVVEQIFAWPGLGSYTVGAITNSDFPAIVGVSLVAGAVFVILNAAVDIFQAAADPRVALQ
ncbi:MAG: gsiC 2 [Acidimicrobiales bacterium]|nr:gsiC 2 [Acidimicrobiales bacterium]